MVQEKFIQALKNKVAPNVNLVNIIAEVLNISVQGAYKKINLTTKLTLEEANKLANHLKLSLDQSLGLYATKDVPFQFYSNTLRYRPGSLEEYWTNVKNHISSLSQLEPTKVIYLANELPVHHFIQFENLLKLKLFNWNNTSWYLGNDRQYENPSLKIDPKIRDIFHDIIDTHNSIASIEIWNSNMLAPTYNQIKHWVNARLLTDKLQLQVQLDEIGKLILFLKNIAANGYKMKFGNPKPGAECSIYINDISVNSELIYIKSDNVTMIYSMYDAPNYLRSQDAQVCSHASAWLNELIDHSEPISKSNTSKRNIFFDNLIHEYEIQRKKIELLFAYINE